MPKLKKLPPAVKRVRADRISTSDVEERVQAEEVCVVEEVPVTVAVQDGGSYTVLCTPADLRELAAGFLYTEGVIAGAEDIEFLEDPDRDPHTVRVRLVGKRPRIWDTGRNMMIVSSCGACGSENLREAIHRLPRVGDSLRIDAGRLHSVYGALGRHQDLFRTCGGTHAAAVFDSTGAIVAAAEDTGRHNALDKTIGKCLLGRVATAGQGVALTSRLSLEMVAKCARAGIELVTAISAPTSMAIEVGDQCGITLCAFVRETRATVFTHPARVVGVL